jgi:hypothetical protein
MFSSFQQEFEHDVEATGIPITAWAGAKKTYLCNVGVTGTITTISGTEPDVYWGFVGEVFPLTRWSGGQTLRLKLRFYTKNVSGWSNLVANWKIYEVT